MISKVVSNGCGSLKTVWELSKFARGAQKAVSDNVKERDLKV